jgi:hypothetical protein
MATSHGARSLRRSELIFDIELVGVKDAPQLSAAADLLLPFTELQEKVLALAKAAGLLFMNIFSHASI